MFCDLRTKNDNKNVNEKFFILSVLYVFIINDMQPLFFILYDMQPGGQNFILDVWKIYFSYSLDNGMEWRVLRKR